MTTNGHRNGNSLRIKWEINIASILSLILLFVLQSVGAVIYLNTMDHRITYNKRAVANLDDRVNINTNQLYEVRIRQAYLDGMKEGIENASRN